MNLPSDPYTAPADRTQGSWTAWKLVGLSLTVGFGLPGIGILLLYGPEPMDFIGALLIPAGLFLAILLGIGAVIPAWRTRSPVGGLFGVLSAAWFGMVGVSLVYISMFARGRQLRQGGTLKLPPVVSGGAWASAVDGRVDVPDVVRSTLAGAWRQNGRTEHASVAAFARTSLELVALGAPPELLTDAARDAVDEIRHTEACFSLAHAIDGRTLSPGPFPEASSAGALTGSPTQRFVSLAVTSLVDGALHEGVSANVIGALRERCEIPAIRAVLETLAADETRHAEHAWEVVEFCLAQGGKPVYHALAAAAAAISEEISSPHPPEATDGAWERYGIAGRALEQAQYTAALTALRERLGHLLQSAPARALQEGAALAG